MITYKFSVVIEKDRDGYFAFCPELQGCYTQGDTKIKRAKEQPFLIIQARYFIPKH